MAENKNMEEVRKVNYLHLVYIIIIFVIVLLAIWLASPYIVCEESLVKFEFAATITSIVLAVISIIFSLSSGYSISQNLGSMRDASEKIGDVGGKLETIQTSLKDDISHLNTIEQNMQTVLEEVIRTRKLFEGGLAQNKKEFAIQNAQEDKFDITNSSIAGLLIIYACSLAYEQGEPLPAALVGNPFYVHGYVTALEISASKYFRALALPTGHIQVNLFNKAYFGKATDANYISEQMQKSGGYVQAQESLKKIKDFYKVQ